MARTALKHDTHVPGSKNCNGSSNRSKALGGKGP
jgi:hypothetical protein